MDTDNNHSLVDVLSSENGTLKLTSKIIYYLSNHFVSEYEWTDLENLIKMFIIFYESMDVNGENLTQLSNDDQWFLKNSFTILQNEERNSTNFVTIINNAFKSTNSIKMGVLLDNIFSFVKKYFNYNIQLDSFTHKMSKININRKKMYAIIERLFVLPSSEIEKAIESVITNVGFEILGHVFCEPSSSIYFEKCTIVSDIICINIENSVKSIIDFFMPSILLVLKSKSGISLYKKCLKNKKFDWSLNVFLQKYLRSFKRNVNSKQYGNNYLLDCQMSYLIHVKFNEKTNSHLDLFKEFNNDENSFFQDYLTNINMLFS